MLNIIIILIGIKQCNELMNYFNNKKVLIYNRKGCLRLRLAVNP